MTDEYKYLPPVDMSSHVTQKIQAIYTESQSPESERIYIALSHLAMIYEKMIERIEELEKIKPIQGTFIPGN